jgi:hypothetical protein
MSDCKHEKRSDYLLNHPRYVSYCQHCDADFTKFELDTLERAERAEALVGELDIQLSEAKNLLGLALATFNASQGNSKIIISEWLKENDK